MARLVWPAALLLLLASTDTGIIHENIHIWTNNTLNTKSPLQINCFLPRPNEHVSQVNWVKKSMTMNKTIVAVFNPGFGIYINPRYRENLQVHFKSNHNISITLTRTDDLENGTSYCCKFVTYPSGSLEECLKIDFTKQESAMARCAVADGWYGCSSIRTKYIVTLVVVGGLLVGIFILLCCIQKMRHRESVQIAHHGGRSTEGTAMPLEVQHPAKRALPDTPLSAFYAMINIDYFANIFKARVGRSHTSHSSVSSQTAEFVTMDNTLYSG
ncbi:hypothetical protein NDU88_000679 [Pleurodeles waltl]|uniref:Transmembrane protein PVRIG immunoglobulin-like domain-containing protein n=1 Tax=Pleurodeles waltl TaxID=8319 RepID=A0AAV7KYI2_PLEWA|nr:hypothetical protein NDU88_000679 [Pleurodeles waltl]